MPAALKKTPDLSGKKPLPASLGKKTIAQPRTTALTLPEELSTPSDNLLDYTFLIYGERKIGKTTLLAQFEDPFFLLSEPAAKGLSIRKREVENWKEFNSYIDLLEKRPDYCKMVVLDTGDGFYNMCHEDAKADLGLEDIRDKAWGGGYVEIRARFKDAHKRLYNRGTGFAVTAHSEIQHVKPKFGPEYDRLSIQLGGQAFKYYAGIVDTIAYYHYDDNGKRILTIRGDETVVAGTRCKGHFLYPDGSPIFDIPMGESEEEGYANLVLAFNNELPTPAPSKSAAAKKKI